MAFDDDEPDFLTFLSDEPESDDDESELHDEPTFLKRRRHDTPPPPSEFYDKLIQPKVQA